MVLDLIFLGMLALAMLNGWRSGAVIMILSLVGLIVAGLLASHYGGAIGDALGVGPSALHPIIGFLIAFLVLTAVFRLIRIGLKPRGGLLRGIDGIVGLLLGLLRGIFVLSIILLLLQLIHFPPQKYTEQSRAYPWLLKASAQIIHVLKPLAISTKDSIAV